jgi:septal ring-binding cell division protein DamX
VATPIPAGVAVPSAPPQPVAKSVPSPAPLPAPKPAPAPRTTQSEAAPQAPVVISVAARLKALEQGDLDLAVRQGERLLKATPPNRWTLRLEIACQGETIRHVVEIFQGRQPDLFLLPIVFRDGRNCYQVLLGQFPSQQAAEKEVKHLPSSFLAGKNRPKVFRLGELPQKQ